ncbi:hypothetical protein L0U89_18115 [Mariniradius sp. RY-2]|uniref:Uncharacterized protein n=1 Tax=Mariniradius sediminis TaxID=2909237 RepID=A0ABS9BY51_9BACT|nr:hypothetical protein [Mariniradius sediminis]
MKRNTFSQRIPNFSGKLIFCIYLLVLLLDSCASYNNIESIQPKSEAKSTDGKFNSKNLSKLRQGDRIIVQTYKSRFILIYDELEDGELKGLLEKNPLTQARLGKSDRYMIGIPIDEIEFVKVRKFNAPRSIGLGIVSVVVMPLLILMVAFEG